MSMTYQEWLGDNPLRKWLNEKPGRTQAMVAAFCQVQPYTVYCWLNGSQLPVRHWDVLTRLLDAWEEDVEQRWTDWHKPMTTGEVRLDG